MLGVVFLIVGVEWSYEAVRYAMQGMDTPASLANSIRTLKTTQSKLNEDLNRFESRLESEIQQASQQIEDNIKQLKGEVLCCPPVIVTISAPMDPQGQSTRLNLDRDSKWISSCFYTHPRGYKLCLALKSTMIGPWPKHEYTRKPKLHVALVAISQEDDHHRSWPCKGEATLKFLSQRACNTFKIKFSIAKPLDEANVLSTIGYCNWVQLSEEEIPFGEYRNPPRPIAYVPFTYTDIPGYKLDTRIEMVVLSEESKVWSCS